jgi:hypothetical protein
MHARHLGPGPPSLLHLTRANAEKPYAGDTCLMIETNFENCLGPLQCVYCTKIPWQEQREAYSLTNHKVKKPALFMKTTVYKLKHR